MSRKTVIDASRGPWRYIRKQKNKAAYKNEPLVTHSIIFNSQSEISLPDAQREAMASAIMGKIITETEKAAIISELAKSIPPPLLEVGMKTLFLSKVHFNKGVPSGKQMLPSEPGRNFQAPADPKKKSPDSLQDGFKKKNKPKPQVIEGKGWLYDPKAEEFRIGSEKKGLWIDPEEDRLRHTKTILRLITDTDRDHIKENHIPEVRKDLLKILKKHKRADLVETALGILPGRYAHRPKQGFGKAPKRTPV